MPVDAAKASDIWLRYQYIRDNGHLDYVAKARRCEDFFTGLQWDANDLALLRQSRRPALTVNKIISTVSNVMGEQIYNRTSIAYRPRNNGATEGTADALTKVMLQVSDNNQLDWLRSDMFADGIITSRGFLDVRVDFNKNLQGEIVISQLNPINVLVDPDAEEYDPDRWGDVFITKWMSVDQIAMLYNKEDAEQLRGAQESFWPYGYDTIDRDRDRFGTPRAVTYGLGMVAFQGMVRHVRVLERQYKQLDKMEHFADLTTGTLEQVPTEWDRDRISAYLAANPGVTVIKKLTERVRWTVCADKFILHDDWSPYKRFTVVPYFPHFRRGRTTGLVENLLGPQEYLNKIRSQELHVVNTTANSGWKVKSGNLVNMTTGELENRGAQTGLVVEVNEMEGLEKIAPNNTPQGLDRLSYKADEDIKAISGVTDYRTGNAREDVSAKAVSKNQSAASSNTAKIMDNLQRTDFILARNVLDLVQEFYTDPRLMNIVSDRLTSKTEQLGINQIGDDGTITNDLSIGEYDIVITNQPERDTFEDSQFDHAVQIKELGIQIPDKYIIQSSKLRDKAEIVKDIEAAQTDPEVLKQKQLADAKQQAEIQNIQAQAQQRAGAAEHSQAKAQEALAGGDPLGTQLEHEREMQKMQEELALAREKGEQEMALKRLEIDQKMELARYEFEQKMKLEQYEAQVKMKYAEQHEQNQVELGKANVEQAHAQVGATHAQTAATITTAEAKAEAMKKAPGAAASASKGETADKAGAKPQNG